MKQNGGQHISQGVISAYSGVFPALVEVVERREDPRWTQLTSLTLGPILVTYYRMSVSSMREPECFFP